MVPQTAGLKSAMDMASVVNHVHIMAMGYTIFAVGDSVRIRQGVYAGVEGSVLSPLPPVPPDEVVAIKGWSFLLPVLMAAEFDGAERVFRVPPEFLERS